MKTANQVSLSIKEKAIIKRALIAAGVNPSGMDDGDLINAYELLDHGAQPTPKAEPAPEPEPKAEPEQKPEPKAKPEPSSKDPAQLIEQLANMFGNNGGLTEERVIELIQQYSGAAPLNYEVKLPSGKTNEVKGAHKQFERVLAMVTAGLNVFMSGPAGSGKTTLAAHIAEALGVDFYPMGAIFQKYELTGYLDVAGVMRTTEFRKAFEFGGVFLFDEMDCSDASALVAFNAAIANGVYTFPDGVVKKHENFYCIGAANTNGKGATAEYNARTKLDDATMDRYAIIEIEYDEAIETARTHALAPSKIEGDRILDRVRATRAKAKKLGLSCVISPRCSYDTATALSAGIPLADALDYCLYNKLDAVTAAQVKGA